VTDEGIDELARFLGRGEAVAALTARAMSGGMSYREALRERLSIIQPSIRNVQDFIAENPPRLTPGIQRLVAELSKHGIPVFLISGGFRPLVNTVAQKLGIPLANVFANELLFDAERGTYVGFDESQPTSDGIGKAKVVALLKKERGFRRVVHIGDGATDADACPPADVFIGFGGNVVRADVRARAAWYVLDFDELTDELGNNGRIINGFH